MSGETGGHRHIIEINEQARTPEAIASDDRAAAHTAAMIAAKLACPECLARAGQPCGDRTASVHFSRQLAYAKT